MAGLETYSTKGNITDILTKGAKLSLLVTGYTWQHGPPWIVLKHADWPLTAVNKHKTNPAVSQEISKLLKKSAVLTSEAVMVKEPIATVLTSVSVTLQEGINRIDELFSRCSLLENL